MSFVDFVRDAMQRWDTTNLLLREILSELREPRLQAARRTRGPKPLPPGTVVSPESQARVARKLHKMGYFKREQ